MTGHPPQAGTLPDAIKVEHGPVELLRSFFRWACSEVHRRGVTLSFAPLDELVAVNAANADTWMPLVPLLKTGLSGITPETGFAILGRNDAGEVVATQGARFYDWRATSLWTEANSLKMAYADPEAARRRGDVWEITTPVAHLISGRVVFSGGGWYRPDYRGQGLGRVIPRISRAYAFTRWNTDFTISMMTDGVIKGGFADRTGYTNIEAGTVHFNLSPTIIVRGALVWMPATQLLADLASVVTGHA